MLLSNFFKTCVFQCNSRPMKQCFALNSSFFLVRASVIWLFPPCLGVGGPGVQDKEHIPARVNPLKVRASTSSSSGPRMGKNICPIPAEKSQQRTCALQLQRPLVRLKPLTNTHTVDVKALSLFPSGISAYLWHESNLSVYSPGITPLCHVLFALYDTQTNCWYSPNHVFSPDDNTSLVLHFCMRLVCVFITLDAAVFCLLAT